MAGVLAQRSKKAGHLGAAYFCRHNDGTRNDPRCLLGTVACQLCECNSEYSIIMGGEDGVRKLLGNSNLGVQELFTKLLQEPLGKCNSFQQRKLGIIDALDETQYESREDFLDLIMNRFPMLPKWLVFFITSRPEDTVQVRLKKYNPCIKICAGNSEHLNFYQQHEQDIKLFLEKSVDFCYLSYSVEDITKKCNGLFLYAFYIAQVLKDPVHSGRIDQLDDLFPGDIDNFFLQNFKRVFDKVGANLYRKLFGCAIVAPSPLPVSFISFILERENSDLDEQEVIDAVSQFVMLRTSDQSFTFLHNLIPTWLTDKKKASRKLFIDRIKAGEYFRDIIVEFLSPTVFNHRWEKPPFVEADLFNYCLRVGVRFLCEYRGKDSLRIVFSCLTSYQFIWMRIQNNGIEIYSVIVDLKLAARCQGFSYVEKEILQEMCLALESNLHVLQECPHLLHPCLRNASKAVRTNVVIPDGVSTTWIERKGLSNPACEICGMSCFAMSPDKKLLVGGKGQCISLFDACSLEEVFGPIKVMETDDNINHLEFSPDGTSVFFGRLDKWFSVKKRCVEEFPQFSKNCRCYKWGIFTSDGHSIVVQGECPGRGKHSLLCLTNIFCRWATQELQMRSSAISLSIKPEMVNRYVTAFPYKDICVLLDVFLDLLRVLEKKEKEEWCLVLRCFVGHCGSGDGGDKRKSLLNPLCQDCYEFKLNQRETTLEVIRQRVIELYPEIFEYQVWDVVTGRPVLEEAFSSDVMLSPFTFLCHMTTALGDFETLLSGIGQNALSLFDVVWTNVVHYLGSLLPGVSGFLSWPKRFQGLYWRSSSFFTSSFFITNVPAVKVQNRLAIKQSRLSLDGNWIAVRGSVLPFDSLYTTVNLLVKRSELEFGDCYSDKRVDKRYVITNVLHFAFADDSSSFLYITEGKSLHTLHLQTGTNISCVSGVYAWFYAPKKQFGYLFKEEAPITIAVRLISSQVCKAPLGTTFISAATILSLFSDAVPLYWKATGDDALSSQGFHVEKCVFSQDGHFVVIHQDTEILLFAFGEFVCSLFDDQNNKNDVSCLIFSPDSTLLLCCIQNCIDCPHFYVLDVQNRVFSASFDSPSGLLSIECCCLSSDNTKLIICGGSNIEIWNYDTRPCRLLTLEETDVLYTVVDKFTHCTVSLGNDLLACCIVDRILLFPFNTSTDRSVRYLPRAHLGKIEFCQFLKGNRYLISYGVDGTVFLWDLSQWKAIAYAKVAQGRESIVSMRVFPEEDEVVCLTSFGRLSMLKLCGIVHEMPSKFHTTEAMNRQEMALANRRQQREETPSTCEGAVFLANEVESVDWTEFVEEMNIMADENLESEDDIYEGESDE